MASTAQSRLAKKVLEELASESKKMKAAGLSPEAIKAQLKASNPTVSPSDINKAVKEVDVSKIKVNIPEKAAPINPIPTTPAPVSASNAGTLPAGVSKPTLDHKKVLENLNADEIAADIDASKAGKWNKKKAAAVAAGAVGTGGLLYGVLKDDAKDMETAPPQPLDDETESGYLSVTKEATTKAGVPDETQLSFGQLTEYMIEPDLEEVPNLDPAKIPDMKEAISEYNRVVNEAMTLYRQEKKDIKTKQLWEGIIHGVALMAAGAYGLKTGNYATGVKFDPTDWSAQLTASRAELEAGLNQARTVLDISDKQAERERQVWESNRQRRKDIIDANAQVRKNVLEDKQFKAMVQKGNIDIKMKTKELEQEDKKIAIMEADKKAQAASAMAKFSTTATDKESKVMKEVMKLLYDNELKDAGAQKEAVMAAASMLQEAGMQLPPDFITKPGLIYGTNSVTPSELMERITRLRYGTGGDTASPKPMATVTDTRSGRSTKVDPAMAKKFEGRPGFKVTYD